MATYTLPFGLSAEPKGRVVSVTKDGEFEKVGDILRFTLEWRGGEASPAMFDVCSCMEQRLDTSFDRVVKALTSNDGTCACSRSLARTNASLPAPEPAPLASADWLLCDRCADANEIVLIFERPLAGASMGSVLGEVV